MLNIRCKFGGYVEAKLFPAGCDSSESLASLAAASSEAVELLSHINGCCHLDFLKTFAHIVLFDKGLKRNKFKDMPQGLFYDMSTKRTCSLAANFPECFS